MLRARISVLVVIALCLVGCSERRQAAMSAPPERPDTNRPDANGPAPTETPKEKPPTKRDDPRTQLAEPKPGDKPVDLGDPNKPRQQVVVDPKKPQAPVVQGIKQEQVFKIEGAGKEGWSRSTLSAQDLGRKIDDALINLKATYIRLSLYCQDAEKRGLNTGDASINDKDNYKILYQVPTDPTRSRIVISQAGRRKQLIGDQWNDAQPPTVEPAALRKRWAMNFPYELFGPLYGNAHTFATLLPALTSSSDGFHAVVEQKTIMFRQQPATFYRVLAEQPSTKTRYEMRFDGRRFVPVTIRINSVDASGKDLLVQWNGDWRFDRNFSAETFRLPQ